MHTAQPGLPGLRRVEPGHMRNLQQMWGTHHGEMAPLTGVDTGLGVEAAARQNWIK